MISSGNVEHVWLLKAYHGFNHWFAKGSLVLNNASSVMKLPGEFLSFTSVCTVKWQYLKIFEKQSLTLLRTEDNRQTS